MPRAKTKKNISSKREKETQTPELGNLGNMGFPRNGYVTEKLYQLLQMYLKNKDSNPSDELLQCIMEFKEASELPNAAYLETITSRMTLDAEERLVLRKNGKVIIPFEHFANVVMLKHMNGPHGFHLDLKGTVRAVMNSCTIGRENFGMEEEIIIEVLQNCSNSACHYYENQMEEATREEMQMCIDETEDNSSKIPMPIPPHDVDSLVGTEQFQKQMDVAKDQQIQQQLHFKTAYFLKKIDRRSSKYKDLLALHNSAWATSDSASNADEERSQDEGSQENFFIDFAEVIKNLQRIRASVRPTMCKPYGKQSEALQKTLLETIQLVQSLRSSLPPSHILVSSWENEDETQ